MDSIGITFDFETKFSLWRLDCLAVTRPEMSVGSLNMSELGLLLLINFLAVLVGVEFP